MESMQQQKGGADWFALALTAVFLTSLAYWLWRAYVQVNLEIDLACRMPEALACASARARYTDSFMGALLSQMFPWLLPFVPAFIYVIFFRWLRRNRQAPG